MYVACEGERTEPDYLNYLTEAFGDGDDNRQPFRIQPVWQKKGMTPTVAVAAARRAAGTDEAWALFDRDGTDRNDDIHQALKDAAAKKVEFGLSDPSFELWLLLHFQSFSGAQNGHNKDVIDKLRSIDPAFRRYNTHGEKSIRGPRREALRGREDNAVNNAKALVQACETGQCTPKTATVGIVGQVDSETPGRWAARSGHSERCPILARDPSTDVWRLLVTLGIV